MSAICGFLNLDSVPAAPEMLAAQMDRVRHLGPDGAGTFTSGPVALGHALLSITPESVVESSPWRGTDGQVIAFDGRLDYREDLCAELNMPPTERSLPDPALVLRAHEKWGGDCLRHLEGEFAFALWDGRKQELFCAVDALGRRDFFYHCDGRRFSFASRIRSVLAVPGVPRQLDELTLGCELARIPRPGDRTLYAGIHRLPDANCLTVRSGGQPTVRAYWHLTMEPVLRLNSPEEYAEALRELLERSVHSALRSRHPVAAMLSGGLDSTGVAGLAARALAARGQRLTTVSTVLPEAAQYGEWSDEESSFIRAALAMYPNMDPQWARGLALPVVELDDACYALEDEPEGDLQSYRTFELAQLAQQNGARLLLSGVGGDLGPSLQGIGYLGQLVRTGHWLAMGRELAQQSRARRLTAGGIFWREVLSPLAPRWLRRWNERLRHPHLSRWQRLPIHPEFAARLPLGEWDPARRLEPSQPADWRAYFQTLVNERRLVFRRSLRSRHLPHMEKPHPFTDRRLWDWCYRVPLGEFIRDGRPRSLYRRALADVLPPAILWRTSKGGYAPDYGSRIGACQGAMRDFLDQHPASHAVWSYVDRPMVVAAMERLNQSRFSPGEDRQQTSLCLGLRLAHFISWFHRSGRRGN